MNLKLVQVIEDRRIVMTESEKAKAYDEALKRAKAILKVADNRQESLDYVSTIFPELAESEDEKIRKELITWLKNTEGQVLPIDRYNAALAWLEKQGEQNFTDNKEKLDLLNFIRKETGCGLAEANNALLKLNKVLKQHPVPIMDKPRKLKIEWEE